MEDISDFSSRYATREEALSDKFMSLNREFERIQHEYKLPDFAEFNHARYPWAKCLSSPEFYASRMWEYPWAILESEVTSELYCADIGCGQTPFPIYLKEVIGCQLVCFDPHYGEPVGDYFGVPETFVKRTGIQFVKSAVQHLDWPDESLDRVYCISVIEHIPKHQDRAMGMREIVRVLKPGGLAVISVDVNLKKRIVNPLELIWESGLELYGAIDLTMPTERFGIFNDGKQPADVFGFILRKQDRQIKTDYGDDALLAQAWRVASLRATFPPEWPDEYQCVNQFDPHIEPILSDWKRNRTPDGKPSIVTFSRILLKGLLGRYPKFVNYFNDKES